MQIRVGFEMAYECPAPTPMILALSIHYSRASDLVRPDHLVTDPPVPVTAYRNLFGNWCSRLVAPAGRFVLSTDAVVKDSGLVDFLNVTKGHIETDAGLTDNIPIMGMASAPFVDLAGEVRAATGEPVSSLSGLE